MTMQKILKGFNRTITQLDALIKANDIMIAGAAQEEI